ncbi:MAG TPA: lycopene cyclase domain-containing protein [Polyangiaceae bacterium]|nr:lycopene cyclase domain-containing protein [Polyangiaceae bacterium]
MKWLYLALDLAALSGPLVLSFDRRVAFYRNYRSIFSAILCMMLVFVPTDMAFVAARIWGFDPRYVSGITLGNLPIEEWLFFPTVSYACLFIYECLRHYVPVNPIESWHRPVLVGIATGGLLMALSHPTRLYTSLKVGAASLAVLAVLYLLRPDYLARFFLTYLISWVPFLIMNGVLTGAFIDGQVVWYAPEHILGVRIGTIPIEDAYYSLMMLLTSTVVYEALRRRLEVHSQSKALL